MSDAFNENDVKGLVEEIKENAFDFITNAEKTNNKAAARRARKSSLVLNKLLKEFRSISLK
jgi:hypothetical protein